MAAEESAQTRHLHTFEQSHSRLGIFQLGSLKYTRARFSQIASWDEMRAGPSTGEMVFNRDKVDEVVQRGQQVQDLQRLQLLFRNPNLLITPVFVKLFTRARGRRWRHLVVKSVSSATWWPNP